MRARGLKLSSYQKVVDKMMSRPVRARGLKPRPPPASRAHVQRVAPRAGAWIETLSVPECYPDYLVAPRAGAWIETWLSEANRKNTIRSRPVRARGLKRVGLGVMMSKIKSRPVRARGLKHRIVSKALPVRQSRPVRARGLKHRIVSKALPVRQSRPVRARGLKRVVE